MYLGVISKENNKGTNKGEIVWEQNLQKPREQEKKGGASYGN